VIGAVSDYLLWYAKSAANVKYRQLYRDKVAGEEGATAYQSIELPDGARRKLTRDEREGVTALPE